MWPLEAAPDTEVNRPEPAADNLQVSMSEADLLMVEPEIGRRIAPQDSKRPIEAKETAGPSLIADLQADRALDAAGDREFTHLMIDQGVWGPLGPNPFCRRLLRGQTPLTVVTGPPLGTRTVLADSVYPTRSGEPLTTNRESCCL